MESMRITVYGATGFVGRRLTARLLGAGHHVRAVARHIDATVEQQLQGVGHLEVVAADIMDSRALTRAQFHSDLVINLVGAVSLPDAEAYFDLHKRGARNIAEATYASGTARLLHISALGVSAEAPSAADRSKAAGELAVRSAFPAASLVRPSLLFGENDHFLSRIDRISRISPVIPLLGADTRVQPLHVDDFTEGLARMVERPDTDGHTFEFAGPRVYRLRQIVELLLEVRRRRRVVVPLPLPAALAMAQLMRPLPHPPLSRPLIELMSTDKLAAVGAAGITDLGVQPRSLEQWLRTGAG